MNSHKKVWWIKDTNGDHCTYKYSLIFFDKVMRYMTLFDVEWIRISRVITQAEREIPAMSRCINGYETSLDHFYK